MAKGAIAKGIILNKILDTFEGAFLYNDGKEIRIPMDENGETIQIKVTLTAAKTNVNPGDDNALPEAVQAENNTDIFKSEATTKDTIVEPTKEEKENLKNMLKSLGL